MSQCKLFDKKFSEGKIINLFESFDKIDIYNIKRELNYFDVAGYSHYENVASNILEFFLNTYEIHNMNDLWLRSLIEKYYDKIKEETLILGKQFSSNEIERETNSEGKRIDLFIRTDDTVIIIENKIRSGDESNPYDIYHKKAEEIKNQYNLNYIIEILLTVDERENKINENIGYKFINIKYSDLFDSLRCNIGQYIKNTNEKWLIYMNEFIKNIENMEKENKMEYVKNLDKKLQEIYADEEKEKSLQHMLNVVGNDFDMKKNFLKEVVSRINNNKSICDNTKISVYNWHCGKNGQFDGDMSIVIDIHIDGEQIITIEPYISRNNHPNLLMIAIWNRTKKYYDINYKVIENIVGKKDLIDIEGWGKSIIVKKYDFSKDDISENTLADELTELALKIYKEFDMKC